MSIKAAENNYLNILYLENRTGLALFIDSIIYSKSRNDVEDCLQEVFLIVIRKVKTDGINGIESHPNVKGWLFAIAKNVAKKFNAAYMKTRNDDSIDPQLLIGEDDFTEQVLENIIYDELDKEQLISDIMSELTKSEREIFELRLNNYSNREIAEVLNKSESTVKSTYSRLKPKLKSIIDKEVN
ncbi:MAG: sigma-70 family RNA polymerase sigma factor [Oscillospiraceae bacterium]|nr:sigma-70 family RNA polymerase sigma factor [Oscillospiraceae bacterium]